MKIIMILILMIGMIFSFAPEPTEYDLIITCEETGGTITETNFAPDCGPGCSAMPETFSDCHCNDGITYMDIKRISDFQGCDGSQPVCYTDDDCMRTNQGNVCGSGYCMYVQQPDDSNHENDVCMGPQLIILSIFGLIGMFVFRD